MKIDEFIEGLQILRRVTGNYPLSCEHDQFWVYLDRAGFALTEEEARRLEQLGWFLDDNEAWSCYP